MSLRDQAAADLVTILEDPAGFRCAVTVTNPAGATGAVYGFVQDIGRSIDPETGVAVTGQLATAALPIARLLELGLGMPKAVADTAGKPWRMSWTDVRGQLKRFKVQRSEPDEHGVVVCTLEHYKQA